MNIKCHCTFYRTNLSYPDKACQSTSTVSTRSLLTCRLVQSGYSINVPHDTQDIPGDSYLYKNSLMMTFWSRPETIKKAIIDNHLTKLMSIMYEDLSTI